jgi:hypothetical protein
MLRTRSQLDWLLIACVMTVAGCRQAPEQQSPKASVESRPAPATQRVISETSNGNYHVTYTSKPDPIPLNELFTLEVNVYKDANLQHRPSGVAIEVDADMPAHQHGMTLAPRIEPISDGQFRVTGMLFHMPGHWEIYIDVIKDGEKERARFEVEIP